MLISWRSDRFQGGCSVHFLELEPPGARLFTKAGVAAGRLNGAITQVQEWMRFVAKNREVVLKEISKSMKQRELVFGHGYDIYDNTGRPIWDPKLWIHFHYHILIGRRKDMDEDQIERKAAYPEINIATYDRVLDYADASHASITRHVVTMVAGPNDLAKLRKTGIKPC